MNKKQRTHNILLKENRKGRIISMDQFKKSNVIELLNSEVLVLPKTRQSRKRRPIEFLVVDYDNFLENGFYAEYKLDRKDMEELLRDYNSSFHNGGFELFEVEENDAPTYSGSFGLQVRIERKGHLVWEIYSPNSHVI